MNVMNWLHPFAHNSINEQMGLGVEDSLALFLPALLEVAPDRQRKRPHHL